MATGGLIIQRLCLKCFVFPHFDNNQHQSKVPSVLVTKISKFESSQTSFKQEYISRRIFATQIACYRVVCQQTVWALYLCDERWKYVRFKHDIRLFSFSLGYVSIFRNIACSYLDYGKSHHSYFQYNATTHTT